MTRADFYALTKHTFAENGLSDYAADDAVEKFFLLTDIMRKTNEKMNITAITDEEEIIARHYADCLFAVKYLPQGATVLDVGSGGGMPTLPFAIVRPDIKITALDATAKKTAYIADAARALELTNVKTICGRAEELGKDPAYREKFDLVCARAVARLNILLEWCIPFCKVNGIFIAMKGKNAEEELNEAISAMEKLNISLSEKQEIILREKSGNSSRENLIFHKDAETPAIYPRTNAQIKKKPL